MLRGLSQFSPLLTCWMLMCTAELQWRTLLLLSGVYEGALVLSAGWCDPHCNGHRTTASKLGFSALLKDTLTCGEEEPGIEPPTPVIGGFIYSNCFYSSAFSPVVDSLRLFCCDATGAFPLFTACTPGGAAGRTLSSVWSPAMTQRRHKGAVEPRWGLVTTFRKPVW